MEFIDGLFQLAQNNFILTFAIGFLAAFSEPFFSPLPIIGIVVTNSILLGFLPGLTASILGSLLGSIILFTLCNKFGNSKLMKKLNNSKVNTISHWIREQGFMPMTICYACPFIPDILITIASGISKKSFQKFFPGLVCGKLIFFSVTSYIGNDLMGFITNPIKIVIVLAIIFIAFILGRRVSNKIELSGETNLVLN
ncbi:MAG: VTT domain-containing protein [Clostridium sp.]